MPRPGRGKRRAQRRGGGRWLVAVVPPLRGPTRPNAARRKKSGRSGRDDGQRRNPKSTARNGCATRKPEDRLKPVLHGGGEEYNRGHGQQTDSTDIAGDGFAFAD